MDPIIIYPMLIFVLLGSFFVAAWLAAVTLKKNNERKASRELDMLSGSAGGSSSASDRGEASERFANAVRNQRDGWEGAKQGDSRAAFLESLEYGEISEEEYQARPDVDE